MEAGSVSDDVALGLERGASFADDCVELLDRFDVFVEALVLATLAPLELI